jgi:hypothetical protein
MSTKEYVYNTRLKELNASDYEMAKGEPDIKGWKVISIQNQEIGKVSELLFDEVSRRVRYIVVDLNGKPLNLVSRYVIIPVGLAELHRNDKTVLFPEMTIGHLASLPNYEKGKITIETERAIRSVFAPTNGINYLDEDFNDPDGFYEHEHFDENRFYRPRVERAEDNSLKEEIRENIERVKESVRKMETDVERLGKNEHRPR